MRIKLAVIVIAIALASTAAYSEPLDVKPGLWEITTTTAMSGMPPIDTRNMTPEQKARFEAAMKARQGQGSRAHVSKSCVTKERLEREPFQEKDNESCTHTVISGTRTKWQTKLLCTKPKSVGEFKIEALSRERIKGAVQMNESDDKHAMTVQVSIAGKWLGSNCGDIK
jgi:hypothetical protein